MASNNSETARELDARAREVWRAGRHAEAVALLHAAFSADPSSLSVLKAYGCALTWTSEYEDAIKVLRRALQMDPHDTLVRMELAMCLYRRRRFSASAREYRHILYVNADNPQARCGLGLALLKLGRAPEALRQLELSIDRSPYLAEAHCGMGAALLLMRKWARARRAYERAITLAPDSQRSWFGLALTLHEMALRGCPGVILNDARSIYLRLLLQHPDWGECIAALAIVELNDGNDDHAITLLYRAARLSRPHYWLNHAARLIFLTLLRKMQFQRALTFVHKLAENLELGKQVEIPPDALRTL